MVFGKFTELIYPAPKSSTLTYKTPGLPPLPSSLHNNTNITSPEKKTYMRLSSSLQDLSTYTRLDIEQGDNNNNINSLELEGSANHAFPSNILNKENSLSSFSKQKVPPNVAPKRKKWARVLRVILCLIIFASLAFALQFLYSNYAKGLSKYYVVLDCGSTGTRVYVYQASVNCQKDDNLPILLKSLPENFNRKPGSQNGRAYNRMETEPGFDKLVHNFTGLKKAMKPLIQWAEKQIPKSSHKSTSLFLYATAGVRRLPTPDSEWLLENAFSILKKSPFLCKKEWVKTITGMEEAYYGWIALNYNTGILGSVPKRETFGALDLGGSSLQVTFEGKKVENDETSLKLSIGKVNHHLSAYSLAGYGLNDAFDKSVAQIFKKLPKIKNNIKIKHPCLQSGYKERYSCSRCNSIRLSDVGPPIEGKKPGQVGKSGLPVLLIGAPNWDECTELAKSVVNLSEWSNHGPGIDCEVKPCALTENLPRPEGQFYAMSGFFVVYRFFNLTHDSSLDDVLEKGREFCEKTWDFAKKSVTPQPFIEQYCFRAPYVARLLREGLHISNSNVIVDSGSITWTLGVALFEAGKAFPNGGGVFSGYGVLRVKINPFIFSGVLLASIFVLICAISCVGKLWVPKFLRRSYLPIFRHNGGVSASVLNIPAPFRFQRWSPMNTGKMPLSPTVANNQPRPFDTGLGFGGVQFTDSSLYSSSSSVAHSYSSGSLGQMQFDNNNLGSYWTPHGSQMRLQSRRSQSREDLSSSIAEAHLAKN